jgi:hypothetical protein
VSRVVAKELDNMRNGDRGACPICSPKPDRLREDQVWGVCSTNKPHPRHEGGDTESRHPVRHGAQS